MSSFFCSSKAKLGLCGLCVFVFGIILGSLLRDNHRPFFHDHKMRFLKKSSSPFINPLLECDDSTYTSNKQVNDLKQRVLNLIATKKTGGLTSVSVYFRDLNNGPWFGIEEDKKFIPGSLLKVPLMIGIFEKAQNDPALLFQKIEYGGSLTPFPQFFKPAQSLTINSIYTINDLVTAMIKYSDNDAALLLAEIFKNQNLNETYSELGIEEPNDGSYTMAVSTYASFFRILYNATLLNHTFSSKALSLLSETDFSGINAPLPKDIVVAHKFGERTDLTQKQLHDCGVVYLPKKPYLLCVMTTGNDFTYLQKTIQEISKIVYEDISRGTE